MSLYSPINHILLYSALVHILFQGLEDFYVFIKLSYICVLYIEHGTSQCTVSSLYFSKIRQGGDSILEHENVFFLEAYLVRSGVYVLRPYYKLHFIKTSCKLY